MSGDSIILFICFQLSLSTFLLKQSIRRTRKKYKLLQFFEAVAVSYQQDHEGKRDQVQFEVYSSVVGSGGGDG